MCDDALSALALSHPRELAQSFATFAEDYVAEVDSSSEGGRGTSASTDREHHARRYDAAYLHKVFSSCPRVAPCMVPALLDVVLKRIDTVYAGEIKHALSQVGGAKDRQLATSDVVAACSPAHLARVSHDAPRVVGSLAQLGGCAVLAGVCPTTVPRDAVDNNVLSAAAATVLSTLVSSLCVAFARDDEGERSDDRGGDVADRGLQNVHARTFVRALKEDVLRVIRCGALLSGENVDADAVAIVALVSAEGGAALAAEVLRCVLTKGSADTDSERVSSVVHALLVAMHELGVGGSAVRGCVSLIRGDLQRLGEDGIVCCPHLFLMHRFLHFVCTTSGCQTNLGGKRVAGGIHQHTHTHTHTHTHVLTNSLSHCTHVHSLSLSLFLSLSLSLSLSACSHCHEGTGAYRTDGNRGNRVKSTNPA